MDQQSRVLPGIEAFDRDGYIVIENLLDAEETELLGKIARRDQALALARTSRADGEGGSIDLVLENALPAGSIYSGIVQAEPLVAAVEAVVAAEEALVAAC